MFGAIEYTTFCPETQQKIAADERDTMGEIVHLYGNDEEMEKNTKHT